MKSAIEFIKEFFHPWSTELALRAIWNMMAFLGIIGLLAFVASMHPYLILPTIIFLALLFSLLYKIDQSVRIRRTFGKGSIL